MILAENKTLSFGDFGGIPTVNSFRYCKYTMSQYLFFFFLVNNGNQYLFVLGSQLVISFHISVPVWFFAI